MSPSHPDPPVIALIHGLPPHARPFPLSALVGRYAPLGENPPPHALYSWESGQTGKDPRGVVLGNIPSEGIKWEGAVPAVTYLAEEVTTTFALAWKLHESGFLPTWGAVLASRQTEGRGQLRRHWHSPAGNLHVTFRLPGGAEWEGGRASVLAGCLLVLAFRSMGFSLTLKWPNDLLAQERYKAGGILLEEREGILMAGMGVNLAHVPPPEQLRRQAAVPAGLLADSGDNRRPPPPFVLWQHLVRAIIQEYTQAVSGHGLSDILTTFTPLLAWTHSRVTLIDGGGSRISGILEGLDAAGNLLLRLDTGEVSALCCGSLSLP